MKRKRLTVLLAVFAACLLSSALGVTAFASGSSPAVVSASDWQSVISAVTAQVSVSTVVAVLASIVTSCIGLVFMWWGLRKAMRALMKAFRRGGLRL